MSERFAEELSTAGIAVISGFARGVDTYAHKAVLKNKNSAAITAAVFGCGVDMIYPPENKTLYDEMLEKGMLISEYEISAFPDAVNFPKRNRIVAGLCDALVVVESKRSGGSLITATIGSSYNKDVFAFPGRAGEPLSEGGNGLIKQNKATLVENAEDVLFAMQWQEKKITDKKKKQIPLQISLTEDELRVFECFRTKCSLHLDELCHITQLPVSKVSALLLQLEFSNLIKSRPGKMYELL